MYGMLRAFYEDACNLFLTRSLAHFGAARAHSLHMRKHVPSLPKFNFTKLEFNWLATCMHMKACILRQVEVIHMREGSKSPQRSPPSKKLELTEFKFGSQLHVED